MKRIHIEKRPDWQKIVENQGLTFHQDYYNESYAYEFSRYEIDQIERATNQIFDLCAEAMNYVINHENIFRRFKIPMELLPAIKKAWNEDYISLYGRFDLAYNPHYGEVKLLEFNADTPTSLIEASVIQWFWLQDFNQNLDQFNSIHEALLEHFSEVKNYAPRICFSTISNNEEDFLTTKYLESLAQESGIFTKFLDISSIGYNAENQCFTDENGQPIRSIFKLYPWEWMFEEEFGKYLSVSAENTEWIEPIYKAIWSNKMFLVVLSELFPHNKYILKCSEKPLGGDYVKKPLLSREGANVEIVKNGKVVESSAGEYGAEGYIYQQYYEIPQHSGHTPVLGSWLVGGKSVGIGIRESKNLITNNISKFTPHYFK